ncbi:hypothetical protein VitviT2T_002832 [Vitis vinifera]|uniref:Uncharacterized protein n=1 Tax=Vitis vinifera TaxID=29760 RepID=A0ABY9BJX2_VITVI|nr:hypothetical protein VitviT2T_002832 [Vitis vinifera]
MFFFLLLSCYLLVFFSSLSAYSRLPHLHGVSRVHATLHSLAYPLKPLTQTSISIQPTKPVSLSKLSPTSGILPKKNATWLSPPCDAWHSSFHPDGNLRRHSTRISHIQNSVPADVPPSPDVSHPEFFSADILPGYLTSGILLRRHSTRISHIRNSVPANVPPYPDVSHPEFFSADIPLGCLTSRIFLRQHSTRISHIQNFVPADVPPSPDISHPKFFSADIPPGYLISRILSGRRSTFSGYLTSGILSDLRSTFFLHP